MSTLHELIEPKELLDQEERAQVRQQMERLLETHHFRNSRRYPALLRFIVEETLDGRGEQLKERLLGVSVFDRPADYDTASDPIVRVTIAEIRKRIAQYYHDEEHDAEIRIELLPGRYMPEFRRRRETAVARETLQPPHFPAQGSSILPQASADARLEMTDRVLEADGRLAGAPLPQGKQAERGRSRRWVWVICSVVAVAALAVALGFLWPRASAVDRMWAPVLASSKSVLFCVPTDVGKKLADRDGTGASPTLGTQSTSVAPTRTFLDFEAMGQNVVFSDMMATLNISNILAVHRHDYHVRLNTMTTLDDLRTGPTILIGGLDNQWTMRTLAPLRFHFAGSDDDGYYVADEKNPENHSWSLDLRQQYQNITRDYAIVARIHNDQTGQPEMVIAGIGMSGTAAAGEFVSNERAMRDLIARVGPAFNDRDTEVVLSTDVVNGIAGSAKVLAVTSW